MSLEDIIANYIAQQRSLGKRYSAEVKILAAFRLSVSDVRLRDIRPEMISRFVERGGTSDETRSKKFRVLSGLFLFAVTRHQLRTSPMPQRPRKRAYSSYVPYIYSEDELKRLLAAVPTATANSRYVIDADTLRALLLLLYGAGLRRGEALRLKIKDVDILQSLFRRRREQALFQQRWHGFEGHNARSHIPSPVHDRRHWEERRRPRPASNARPQAFGRRSPCHRVVSPRR